MQGAGVGNGQRAPVVQVAACHQHRTVVGQGAVVDQPVLAGQGAVHRQFPVGVHGQGAVQGHIVGKGDAAVNGGGVFLHPQAAPAALGGSVGDNVGVNQGAAVAAGGKRAVNFVGAVGLGIDGAALNGHGVAAEGCAAARRDGIDGAAVDDHGADGAAVAVTDGCAVPCGSGIDKAAVDGDGAAGFGIRGRTAADGCRIIVADGGKAALGGTRRLGVEGQGVAAGNFDVAGGHAGAVRQNQVHVAGHGDLFADGHGTLGQIPAAGPGGGFVGQGGVGITALGDALRIQIGNRRVRKSCGCAEQAEGQQWEQGQQSFHGTASLGGGR